MDNAALSREVKHVVLVNKYATPLAIFLVVMGIYLSEPVGAVLYVSLSMLVFSVLLNLSAVPVIKRHGSAKPWLAKARLCINVSVNIILVYCLSGYWTPIWLLLALTPIATAIYENRQKTLIASIGTSLALLLIHLVRSQSDTVSPVTWGPYAAYGLFIILLSLLINELVQTSNSK